MSQLSLHSPMSFLSKWFYTREPDNYEEILSKLASDIQIRRNRLSDIRQRQRRSTLLVTLYTLAFWFLYLTLWYLRWLPSLTGLPGSNGWEKAVEVIPVVVGPVLIIFTRQIVDIWYTRKGDHEEQTLRDLLKKQRTKVDEIKKKTNYNATRNLLERYGGGGPPSPGPSTRRPNAVAGTVPATPQLPGSMQTPVRNPAGRQSMPPVTPESISMRALAPPPQPAPSGPRQKQWYDRLADALLGEDDSVTSSPKNQYALICAKCFKHNGLVRENMWESAQYVCPHCGHFNRSKQAKRKNTEMSAESGAGASAPSTPVQTHRMSTRSKVLAAAATAGEGQKEDDGKMDVDYSDSSDS